MSTNKCIGYGESALGMYISGPYHTGYRSHWYQVGLQHLMPYKTSISSKMHMECFAASTGHGQEVHIADGLHAMYFNNSNKLLAACIGKKIV
jgi:hypothetical protein